MAKVLTTGSEWLWVDNANPGISEDNVSQGNLWLNTSTNDLFINKVAALGAQVWDKYAVFSDLASFTPSLAGSSDPGTPTYTTRVGRYVRVGSLIIGWVNLSWSATNGTGNTLITGLPVAANAAVTPVCSFTYAGITLGNNGLGLVGQISGTQIAVSNTISNAALLPLVLPASGTLQTSFMYSV